MAIPAKMREEDKRKHFVWSFWLTLIAAYFVSNLAAFVLVFLIGLAKEWWDQYYGSGFCFFDIMANLLGSSLAIVLVVLNALLGSSGLFR